MKTVSFTDEDGRLHAVLVPEGTPDSEFSKGLPLGPPSIESLGLPKEQEVRLHNQLFHRRLFSARDIKARRQDVFGALQAAFKIDSQRIVDLYLSQEAQEDGEKVKRPRKKPAASTRRRRR